MKIKMKSNKYYIRSLLTLLLLMSATITFAHDFAVSNSNGKTIYYGKNSDGISVYVTYRGTYRDSYFNEYSGEIVIPKTVTYGGKTYSVTSIDSYAFDGCSRLTSVTIPNSVTHIYSETFKGCSGLTSVTIPNSVTSIGDYAFFWCSRLTSVTIPSSVTSIGNYAFRGCSDLTKIKVADGNNVYDSRNNCNAIINTSSNTLIAGCKNTIIPNSVTSIVSYAFDGCSGLTSVTIPNSVTSIGSYAFSGCSRLTSVTIPNSVTSIGSYAFYNTSIKSLTIGTDKQTMESNALRGIDKVIWLSNTPPSGYKNAGGTINYVPNNSYSGLSGQKIYPFLSSMFEVDGIKYVPVSPSERTCDAIDCVYNESAENTKISNTVTYKNINMTVQSVGDSICTGNTYIKNLEYLFDGSICSSAFSGCSGLTSVTIGNSVPSINSSAFSGCSRLTSVSIPNSVTSIGSDAFNGCSGLTSVTIPNSVTSIGSSAFSGCSRLTSVTIPNSVTSIGSDAFNGCSGLTSVTIPNSVTSIGSSAFSGCI